MEKDILKYLKNLFEYEKININIHNNLIEEHENKYDGYEERLWNLEDSYCIYRRKRVLLQIRHYVLTTLTFGIYGLLLNYKYENKIIEIDEKITEIINQTHDLSRIIENNNKIVERAKENLKQSETYFKKLEFLLTLPENESKKIFEYNMGDLNEKNKSN